MPALNDSPLFAMLTEVDRRASVGLAVFNRGVGNTVLSATQFFGDELDELNGRGRRPGQTAQDYIDAQFGGGNITITLNTNDKVQLTALVGTVAVAARADNAVFGFSTAGHGAAVTIAAPNEWQRGNTFNAQLSITHNVAGTFDFPGVPYAVHSIPYLFRERGVIGDIDDNHATDCIEDLDQSANGGRCSWGIDSIGRVWTAYDPATHGDVVWVGAGDGVSDYLGFTRSATAPEAPVDILPGAGAVTAIRVLTATFPCAGVLCPTRQWVDLTNRSLATAQGIRLTSGAVASSRTATHRAWSLRYFVDGPADERDLSTHFVEQWLPLCTPGERMTIYQQWLEPRRAIHNRGSARIFVSNDPQYTTLHTPERDGRQGRLLLYRDPADPNDVTLAWGQRMMRRGEQTMLVIEGKW